MIDSIEYAITRIYWGGVNLLSGTHEYSLFFMTYFDVVKRRLCNFLYPNRFFFCGEAQMSFMCPFDRVLLTKVIHRVLSRRSH